MRSKTALLPLALAALAAPPAGFSQGNPTPVISGIGNAGSYTQPVAPGSLVSIFGSNLAMGAQPVESSAPLPTTLGGTSVSFNGVPAGLLFVSPGQINAQVPSALDASSPLTASVVVSNALGSSAPAQVELYAVGPGIFTSDASGCGQAAALNTTSDGVVSVNSPANSAAPGDYISIFGTGLGTPKFAPPDGTAPSGPSPFAAPGQIYIDRSETGTTPSYSGLAPGLVGLDQINFQIPVDTREGCAVPISMQSDAGLPSPLEALLLSPLATISISKARGQCVDPPTQSYGEVWLEKTIASGTANDGETDEFNAIFPAGPGLQPPPLPDVTPGTNHVNLATPVASSRVCLVQGYGGISASDLRCRSRTNGRCPRRANALGGRRSSLPSDPARGVHPARAIHSVFGRKSANSRFLPGIHVTRWRDHRGECRQCSQSPDAGDDPQPRSDSNDQLDLGWR